jgi:preprotein translocase SecE subunit
MKLIRYFQGVITELRKVSWPTLPQVVRHLISVVIGVAVAVVFVGVVDFVFIKGLSLVIK